jgi:hypothetical protein
MYKFATKPADKYTFLYGKGNENYELDKSFFLYIRESHQQLKRVEFVIDRKLYILVRGWWCDIVLNVLAPTEDKTDVKYSLYKELEHVFDKFSEYR